MSQINPMFNLRSARAHSYGADFCAITSGDHTLDCMAVVACEGIIALGVSPKIASAGCTGKPNVFGGYDCC